MADNELELAETVRNMELTYPEDTQYIDPHLKNLLARMLDKNRETRMSMDMVYTHDWVTSEGTEPLDDKSDSSELSTRSSTIPSTPSRQSSSSAASIVSHAGLHHSFRHHPEYSSGIDMDLPSAMSSCSISLSRINSSSRKISSNSKKQIQESVMILADNTEDSSCPADKDITGMVSSSPEPDGNQVTLPNEDVGIKKSLKSTKMTRMTSSTVYTHTGELRKALKIVAPVVDSKQEFAYHDYDSYDSTDDRSDISDDDVFERRSSPPPVIVDPDLPPSMNPLHVRSKSNLEDTQIDLEISEDELLGGKSNLLVRAVLVVLQFSDYWLSFCRRKGQYGI